MYHDFFFLQNFPYITNHQDSYVLNIISNNIPSDN